MRILQIVPVFSDPFGGPVTVVRSISKELAKKHEVTIYTTTALDTKHDFEPRAEEVNGYRVYYFPRNFNQLIYSDLFGQMNVSITMRKAVKNHLKEFDIVHIHSWQQFPDILLHHYTKKYHIPYVLQTHGSLLNIEPKMLLKWVYDISFGYRILRDASKVIALSEIEAQQYRHMGVSDEKITVVPNGIDFSEYADLPSRNSFKRKYGIKEDAKIVLYLGRIHQSKGLDLLVKAFSIVADELDQVKLIIVGPDDGYLATLTRQIHNLGIEEIVLFTGFVEKRDKLAALIDSDIFVTPHFYGFPVTFLEACLTGCPIVTASNELDWIHNSVGYVVDDSPIALAKAITNVLQDEQISKTFRNNCASVIKNFDISSIASLLEDIYTSVIRTSA